jgi:hypothetical protein
MEPRVKLREFIDAMDLPNQDWQSYLNRDTGEIVTVTDEDRALVDGETDLDDLPDWQREALTKLAKPLSRIDSSFCLEASSCMNGQSWSALRKSEEPPATR